MFEGGGAGEGLDKGSDLRLTMSVGWEDRLESSGRGLEPSEANSEWDVFREGSLNLG